jgi:glycosyltransferase involved in cell wall biosynthesis
VPERILIISNLWPPAVAGGAEAHAGELAERLRGRGHEVGAVTLGVDSSDVVGTVPAWPYRIDAFHAQSRSRRLVFHALDLYRPSTRRVLTDAISRFEPDVVHSHAVAGLSSNALTVPTVLGVPHVHTLHDYWLLCQRRSLTKRNGTRCDVRCTGCRASSAIRGRLIARHPPTVVLAVSRAIADAHAALPWLAARVRIVPNPTERAARTSIPHSGPLTFGFLGRLTVEKGVRTLVAALGIASLSDSRIVVAGDGPLRDELERALPARMELRGWVDKGGRDRFFADIDCLVVPSQWLDPAPLVVGEARAHGVPVIGARIGGIPELVSSRSAQLLFPPGDVGALAKRLEEFARAPATFVDDGPDDLMTWDRHLELVEGAYADARRALPAPR